MHQNWPAPALAVVKTAHNHKRVLRGPGLVPAERALRIWWVSIALVPKHT